MNKLRRFASFVSIVSLLLILAVPAAAQPRRTMMPSDILRVANVTDAQISPNGLWVVYTVSTVEGDKNVSTLWLARIAPDPIVVTPAQPLQRRAVPYIDWPDTRSYTRPLLAPELRRCNPARGSGRCVDAG